MVDKIFYLAEPEAHSKFQTLIQDVPMEHMILGEEIISEAKARLGKKLNDMIYISLIDHVHTAIVRFLEGITVKMLFSGISGDFTERSIRSVCGPWII